MPSFTYAHGQEYCKIDPGLITAKLIEFGEHTIHPGQCMTYIGDGRPHRSIDMKEGFALEYTGYHDLAAVDCRLALFSIFGHQGFKQYNVYYCFRWLERDYIFVVNGPLGGSRSIIPKKINFIEQPEAPDIGPVQMPLWSLESEDEKRKRKEAPPWELNNQHYFSMRN